MKQKVSDYIAEYIAQWGIRDVFTVTGGGAMHMNDAFGHHPKLHCTYQHHEQACAMAAEAYARCWFFPDRRDMRQPSRQAGFRFEAWAFRSVILSRWFLLLQSMHI